MSPPVAAPRALEIELPIERFELACGARLLVSPRAGAPVTAVQVHLRGGASLDPPGLEGLAYLTGSLADQGTRSRDEEEFATALEELGAHVAGSATGLSGSAVSSSWKPFLALLTEALVEPAYPHKNVARQIGRLVDRLRIEAKDPRSQAEQRFRKLVYGRHWLGRPAYGSSASLARIAPKHLRDFHREHWVASRALIAVCGDVEPGDVRRELDRLLRAWKSGQPLPPRTPRLPERGVRSDAFESQREQVHVLCGHLGVRRSDPDYPALVVMDHVLGTGPGFVNRISRRLRDELGLAYSVSANIHATAGILPGMFSAYIGTAPANVQTALEGFLSEIRRMQREEVSEDELSVARDYLVGSFVLGFQRAARRVAWMISAERHGFPDDALARLPREFAAVRASDVRAVAARHLFPERCAVATGGPLSRAGLETIVQGLARKPRGSKRA